MPWKSSIPTAWLAASSAWATLSRLVEQAQEKLDQEEMQKAEAKLRKGEFTLDDFKKQLGQISKLGPIKKIMSMIPGMGGLSKMLGDQNPDLDMKRLVGIIDSMTPDERRNPRKTVDQSRRRRIAKGAGVEPHEVNELVKQFDGMAGMMKEMAAMPMMQRMKAMHQMASSGALTNPNAKFSKPSAGTGKRLTSAERAKLKKQREKELRRKKRKDKGGGDAPASDK